jgi:hypothetical protein
MHILIMSAALATGAWQEPGAPQGPTAYYKLDEASTAGVAVENSGGLAGAYVGPPSPVNTVSTAITYTNPFCLSFSGAGQAVQIPSFGNFTTMTISAWVNRSSNPSARQTIVSYKEGNGVNMGFVLCYEGPTDFPRIYVQVNGTWMNATSATAAPSGTWVHLAGWYDGANIRIYVNGVQAAQTAAAGTMTNNASQNCVIGARADAAQHFFPGRIDDVRVYSRALTATEIQVLAAGCPVPQSLTASSTVPRQVQLDWSAPSGPAATYTYRVKRKQAGAPPSGYVTLATVNTLTYTDTVPWIDVYEYAVTAVSAAESGLSGSQTITPMSPPPRTQEVGNESNECGFGSTFPPGGAGWAIAGLALLLALLRRS